MKKILMKKLLMKCLKKDLMNEPLLNLTLNSEAFHTQRQKRYTKLKFYLYIVCSNESIVIKIPILSQLFLSFGRMYSGA